MDKKFLISVGLSLATVWALQYFWYKPTPTSSEVSLKSGQDALKAGEGIKVPAREDLFKPMKTAALFGAPATDSTQEIVVDTQHRSVTVASRGGGITAVVFKDYLAKDKSPLKTVGKDKNATLPAFALLFDEEAPLDYQVVETNAPQDLKKVVLEAKYKGWLVTKEFQVDETSYKIDLTLTFEPLEEQVGTLSPRLFVPIPLVSELGEEQPTTFVFNEARGEVEKKGIGAEDGLVWFWQTPQALIGAQNKYFIHALTADTHHFVQRAYFNRLNGKLQHLLLEGTEVKNKGSWTLSFYMGPKVYEDLTKVDERLGSVLGGGWFGWITKLMLKFLDFVSKYVKNLGVAIIVLAMLLKLPLTPLSIYSRIKMERYQKHAPIISRIRAKYRNDRQLQLQEVTKYHQEHNISPSTPLIGCLPLVFQLPVMYSLYDILNNYIQLYQAPFFGWIIDLSAKDPFYIIPILMGISMIWQQAMAPVNDEKQRIAMFFVSIVMTVVFAGLPVGLVLYWLVNNVLTIVEDYIRRWFFA